MSFFGFGGNQAEQEKPSAEYLRGLAEGEQHKKQVTRDWVRDTFHTGLTFLVPVMVSSLIMFAPPSMGGGLINKGTIRTRANRFRTRFQERLHDARKRMKDGGEKNPFAAYKEAKSAQIEREALSQGVKPPSGNPFADMMEMMMPIKKRQFKADVKGTKFDDVVGIPEAKEEVRQYVDFLKNPDKFTRLGARLPRGCILSGEPGTGKTLLAKAVAGEAGVPFFSASGSDFIEMMAGSGPKRVRELFEEARANSPCIVFIDEIDAIGSRGAGNKQGGGGGTSSEENRTINQLLAELDGLSTSDDAVVVMAATNLQDNIDKALLREGRFDRKVAIEMPDVTARKEVFTHYLNRVVTGDEAGCLMIEEKIKKDSAKDLDMNELSEEEKKKHFDVVKHSFTAKAGVSNKDIAGRLSQLTPGASPATCAVIVNEAALASAIAGQEYVTQEELQAAVDNVLIGKTHRNRMGDVAKRRTALHECGHALVAWFTPQQNDVLKISIIPRGQALGFTQKAGHEFHEYQTNVTLFTDLMVLLGGRAAEDVMCQTPSIGATDDMQRATQLVMQKLMAFGMDKSRVGLLAFHPEETRRGRSFVHFSENMQENAESAAKKIVEEAYLRAKKMIEDNKDKMEKMTAELVEKSEVSKEDVEKIWGSRPKAPTTAQWTDTLEKEIFVA